MTIKEKNEYKRRAKQAMKENGHKVSMNHMTLLETGGNYIMFEDRKTGRQWQCYYGARYYNIETGSFWAIEEYIA